MSVAALLMEARRQAESASPFVRAAAGLRIARVEAVADRAAGRVTLEMALEEIGRLPEPERALLFEHARMFAAAVAPALLAGIPEDSRGQRRNAGWMLGKTMLEHGHAEAALEVLLRDGPAEAFAFPLAMNMLLACEDQEQRLAVMRRAVSVWQETREGEFVNLFRTYWRVLPAGEAHETVQAVVAYVLNEPDFPMQGSFDQGRLLFTSGREFMLFQVLHILRHLDDGLAAELLAAHEQLAAGARRYPDGWESIEREAAEERRRREVAGEATGGGYVYIASDASRDIPLMKALRAGEFERALEFALEVYREDTNGEPPHATPKGLWPSAARFRSVLYHAGKQAGHAGEELLTRVPDAELQLLARIEFAAGMAGLPEMPNSFRRQGKARRR